jgi:hypothetical protein
VILGMLHSSSAAVTVDYTLAARRHKGKQLCC